MLKVHIHISAESSPLTLPSSRFYEPLYINGPGSRMQCAVRTSISKPVPYLKIAKRHGNYIVKPSPKGVSLVHCDVNKQCVPRRGHLYVNADASSLIQAVTVWRVCVVSIQFLSMEGLNSVHSRPPHRIMQGGWRDMNRILRLDLKRTVECFEIVRSWVLCSVCVVGWT